MRIVLASAFILFMAVGVLLPSDAQAQRRGGTPDSGSGSDQKSSSSTKPYKEVITDQAETQAGLFIVHQLDGKIFYEIPTAKLGKDMLLSLIHI